MARRNPVYAAIPFLFASCLGGSREFVGDPKLLTSGEGRTVQVSVLRGGNAMTGGNYRFSLELDGTLIARLGGGDYVQFYVAPGEHFILLHYGDRKPSQQLQRFDAVSGEPAYFRLSNDWTGINLALDRLSKEDGKAAVASGDYELLAGPPTARP